MPAQPPHTIELLLLKPGELQPLDAWLALLDDDERTRHTRLRHEADRLAFVAAHGLLRRALSLRTPGMDPRAWSFVIGPSGKPSVANSSLRFNLSHCRELVAVAISRHDEVGVDVEPVNAALAGEDVAQRVYGPSELAELAALPAQPRLERFFERWTVKESWVKATGVGLDDNLPAFEVQLRDGVATCEAPGWQFRYWTPMIGVKLGLCVATSSPLDVTPRWWPS